MTTTFSVPQLPTQSTPLTDSKGMITGAWANFHKNLTQYMQTNLNQEGYQLPLLTTSQINLLTDRTNIGRIVFNTDTNQIFVGTKT